YAVIVIDKEDQPLGWKRGANSRQREFLQRLAIPQSGKDQMRGGDDDHGQSDRQIERGGSPVSENEQSQVDGGGHNGDRSHQPTGARAHAQFALKEIAGADSRRGDQRRRQKTLRFRRRRFIAPPAIQFPAHDQRDGRKDRQDVAGQLRPRKREEQNRRNDPQAQKKIQPVYRIPL